MLLVMPGICDMVRGEAWQASMQSAKMWRRCAAFIAFVASSFVAQAAVGVLSHQQAMCAWVRSANCSRTIHCRRSPTISKSEFVVVLQGLVCETMLHWMSSGNWMCHTIGGSSLFRPNHMLPAPFLEALQ